MAERAKAVLTDCGGITEETTKGGTQYFTLGDYIHRPETIEVGTNELIDIDPSALKPVFGILFLDQWKEGSVTEKWNGRHTERIINHLMKIFDRSYSGCQIHWFIIRVMILSVLPWCLIYLNSIS